MYPKSLSASESLLMPIEDSICSNWSSWWKTWLYNGSNAEGWGLMTEGLYNFHLKFKIWTLKSDMGGIFGFFLGTSMVSVVYSFRAASRKIGFCVSKAKNVLAFIQMENSEPQTVHSSTSMSWNGRFATDFGQQLPFKGQVRYLQAAALILNCVPELAKENKLEMYEDSALIFECFNFQSSKCKLSNKKCAVDLHGFVNTNLLIMNYGVQYPVHWNFWLYEECPL